MCERKNQFGCEKEELCESRWVCERVCVYKRATESLPFPCCTQRSLMCFTWWDVIRSTTLSIQPPTNSSFSAWRVCVCVCVGEMWESLCDLAGPAQLSSWLQSPLLPLYLTFQACLILTLPKVQVQVHYLPPEGLPSATLV